MAFHQSRISNLLLLVLVVVFLAACQQEEEPLPTLIDLQAVSANETAAAATATESARLTALPTATRVRTGPTLPPTFTSTPEPTQTAIDPASLPTSTPEGYNPTGVIYYIFNGDSIAAVAGDGSSETIIETFGVGQPITDLTLSPDGTLLAYAAPGNGLAREIYISSLDGTYRQQVTCLNYQVLHNLAWSFDSQRLAFIAAPTPDDPLNVYSAAWIGANNCPEGNSQRQEVTTNSVNVRDVTYNLEGTHLFFSDNQTYALNLDTGAITAPLTLTQGFGADFAYAFRPGDPETLAYLRSLRNPPEREGTLTIIDVASLAGQAPSPYQESAVTQYFQWSEDGNFMLVSSLDSVLLWSWNTRIANSIITTLDMPPQAVFSPSENQIAYLAPDPQNPAVPQIFTVGLDGFNPVQITFHEEGTISDMIWIGTQSGSP